jgi:Cu+-exporting ATPase
MTHDEASGAAKDPVCGMTVAPSLAEAAGLSIEHHGTTYYFCGKGCLLEFRDDPDAYLDPSHTPSM